MARKSRPARQPHAPGPRPDLIQRSGASRRPVQPGTERSIRVTEPGDADPNHHLWRNGRLWWVAFTLIHDDWRQERVRVSLKTDDVVVARRRRDGLLRLVQEAEECEVSLRFVRREANHVH